MNSLENNSTAPDQSSSNDLSAFYQRYIAALNERNFDLVATLVSDEVKINGQSSKPADVLAGLQWLTDIVPDYIWQIEDLFVDGERIAARLQDRGTPAKTFFGAEPTGSSIAFTEFASYRVQNSLFTEMWYLLDTASIVEQLKK
ncbi:ester cyclase [Mucilaginibacter sp. Bleaf8]|uniref:ester cyclase n=1 Tax=Mucilaginibacter sp. Bleaf8 TaxID=2834430 RepID=UPI001BCDA69D|nr:ester cyclase [Mucilaginibacter sp. Bleaf8]MBS7564749.1 ester cyclase [Mucilaginibacter sp. Bleaf8]